MIEQIHDHRNIRTLLLSHGKIQRKNTILIKKKSVYLEITFKNNEKDFSRVDVPFGLIQPFITNFFFRFFW